MTDEHWHLLRFIVELLGWLVIFCWFGVCIGFIVAASLSRKFYCHRCGEPFISPEADPELCPHCHRAQETLNGMVASNEPQQTGGDSRSNSIKPRPSHSFPRINPQN